MGRRSAQAVLAATVLVVGVAPMASLSAQDRAQDSKSAPVPESAMPPAGMCRVWLRDVPERQQPAPTDCSVAIRTMPRDAMVLFGDLKRAARVSPNASTLPASPGTPVRDLPSYRGQGNLAGDGRGAQQRRTGGGSGVTGVSTSAPGGSAAATKAPEPKAAIKPEKPQ